MNVLNRTYDEQAARFLEKAEAKIETKLLGYMPYFDDDKEFRDVYQVTITRKDKKPWVFKFGQSIMNSSGYVEKAYQQRLDRGEPAFTAMKYRREAIRPPSDYSILAAIEKNDPEDFENFCANYGYEVDSRKAEKLYFAVQKEWKECSRVFGDLMDQLQEIA